MTTATEIITDAHLFAGIGDVYNVVDANNAAMALRMLNTLLDSTSVEEYSVFDIVEGTFPLVNGTQVYQLGPTGAYAIRPASVTSLTIVDSSNVTHPVKIMGVQDWSEQLIYKPAPGRPEYVYFDNNVPTCGAYFWPLPSFSNDVVHMWYTAALQSFATGASTLVAPPAYEWWMKTALGAILAEINNKPLSPGKKLIADKAYRNMRALNQGPNTMTMDVPTSDRTSFNIYTGNNNP